MLKKIFSSGLVWIWVAGIVILLDQLTKSWALQHLEMYEPLEVLSVLNLTLALNKGAAFSFLHQASGWQNIVLESLAYIVSVAVIIWLTRISRREIWLSIAICFILGGAIGNAWDRRMYGYVVDFLSFHWHEWYFAIFNIADSAITVGSIMLLLYWLKAALSPSR